MTKLKIKNQNIMTPLKDFNRISSILILDLLVNLINLFKTIFWNNIPEKIPATRIKIGIIYCTSADS